MWVRAYGRKSRALGDPENIDVEALVAHQLDGCERALTALGIQLKPEERIAEIGTGETIEARPKMKRILEDLKRAPPGVGIFAVSEVPRVSRADMADHGNIIRIFARAGVKIMAAGRLFDLNNPSDEQYYSWQAVNARFEVRNYVFRTDGKKEYLTLEGEIPTGAAGLGYKWVKGRGKQRGNLEVIEAEVPIVQALFQEALSLSIPRLARKYGLSQNRVNYILHNPVYTGFPHRHMRCIKRADGTYLQQLIPMRDWTLKATKQGRYTALISLDQFYAVQEALRRRYVERTKTTDADGWCRSLLELEGAPGARVILDNLAFSSTPTYRFKDPATGQNRHYARDPIHQAATEKILAALDRPAAIIAAVRHEETRRLDAENPDERERLRAELDLLEAKAVALKIEGAGADPLDRRIYEKALEQLKDQIRALHARLGPRSDHPMPCAAHLIEHLPALAERGRERFLELPPAQKALLARDLLLRIMVRINRPVRNQPCEREILSLEYAPWFQAFADE